MKWSFFGRVVGLSLSALAAGCYLSHELGDDSEPSDPSRPFPACGDDTTPDIQIRITVDIGDLPSTDAGGPLLTRLEGSCGEAPVEGTEERRGLVWWRDLDRDCAPYRVTLALEGVGARSFYQVRESFCASVEFGRERGDGGGGGRSDPELSVRGGSLVGLGPGEGVVLVGPELGRGWARESEGELHYRDRDGPYDVYGLVYEGMTEYVAMDGTRRSFNGRRPLRVARAWNPGEFPAHGFTLDVSTSDVPLAHRPLRLRFGEHIGTGGPRYAEGNLAGFSRTSGSEGNAPGTAALQPTGPDTLEGDIPLFPDGPWGASRDLESVTAFDDRGTALATVLLDDTIEDVTVLDIAEAPRFSGEYFSEARVAFVGTSWPLVRLTISDGPHRWIVTYVHPTTAVELDPADLPLPAGIDYERLAFFPPFAYVKVEWVEPLGSRVTTISDRNPTPAVVVAAETREFVYDLDEDGP